MARRISSNSVADYDVDLRKMGLEKLQAQLAQLPPAVTAELNRVLEQQAQKLAAHMRAIAPRDDEGKLVASIRVEKRRDLAYAVIVDAPDDRGHPFPAHVEYGHRTVSGAHVSAKPFFWPTLRLYRKRLNSAIKRAARKGMKITNGT